MNTMTADFDFIAEKNHRRTRPALISKTEGQLQVFIRQGKSSFRMVAPTEELARKLQGKGRGTQPIHIASRSGSIFQWHTHLRASSLKVVIPNRDHIHSIVRGFHKGNRERVDYLSNGELIVFPEYKRGTADPMAVFSDEERHAGVGIDKSTEETRNDVFFTFPDDEDKRLFLFTSKDYLLGKKLRDPEFRSRLHPTKPVNAEIILNEDGTSDVRILNPYPPKP